MMIGLNIVFLWSSCKYPRWVENLHGEFVMEQPITERRGHRESWNKGKLVGQKAPLRLKEIWAIRIRLQLGARTRELALFNLAVDSKLRSRDLVKLRNGRFQENCKSMSGGWKGSEVTVRPPADPGQGRRPAIRRHSENQLDRLKADVGILPRCVFCVP